MARVTVPSKIVIDASVAVKWYSEEKDTDKAIALRSRHIEGSVTLLAPDLIAYEIANALRYNTQLTQDDIILSTQDLLQLEINIYPPDAASIMRAIKLAFEYNITIYDSWYLALAEIFGTHVLTADKKLYNKAKPSDLVILLKDIDVT